MNKKTLLLSILFTVLFGGSLTPAEASENKEAQEFPLIYGVNKDTVLKDGTTVAPEVKLKEFSTLSDLQKMYIIRDEDGNEYFCMRRYMAYPEGDSTYFVKGNPSWVDPEDSTITVETLPGIEKKNKAAIAWLIENYYESVDGIKASPIDAFEQANMETKYAATQLVLWTYTNPRTMNNTSYPRTINNNEITKKLVEEAEKQKETNVVDYEELYKKVEAAAIDIEVIQPQGTNQDNYLYSAVVKGEGIDESIMVNVDQESFGLTFGWIPTGQTVEQDITKEVSYTIKKDESSPNQLAIIEFQVPKKYIDSSEKGTLTMKGSAQIESKQSYILYYQSFNGYQPIGYHGKIKKHVVDYRKMDVGDLTAFKAQKEWEDNNNQDGIRPEKIYVALYQNGVLYQVDNPKELNEENKWMVRWGGLPVKDSKGNRYKYTAKELFDGPTNEKMDTLAGYETEPVYPNEEDGTMVIFKNRHTPEVTKLKGEKKWDDGNNQDGKRPDKIIVNLVANGETIQSKEVSAKNNWMYEFDNLPVYKDGKKIEYTVTEEPVPGYEGSIEGTIITNHYKSEVTELKGNKKWDDGNNQDGKRPESITVNLVANGEKIASKNVTEKDKWTYEFTNLPVYKDGKKIEYTVTEEPVPGYEGSIEGTTMTNRHTPEVTELKGNKKWDDGNNQDGKRPESITVNLVANGEKIASKNVTEKDKWTYEFTNLPVYKEGKKIKYTVMEEPVPGYEGSIEGTTITNQHKLEKTAITVTKRWEDTNNQDGLRPESIQVQLYAKGNKVDEPVILNEANKWTHTWNDLDVAENGVVLIYSVEEVTKVPGYTTTISDSDMHNMTIINTRNGNQPPTPVDPEEPTPTTQKPFSENLLNTGEKVSKWIPIIGIILLVGVIISVVIRKKKI